MTTIPTANVIIELQHISKSYGPNHALDAMDLRIKRGTIHGLIGENGAGKSTAMKVIYGAVTPDSGNLLINGKHPGRWSTNIASANEIGMVHQHFMLAATETVLDNLVLGVEKTGFFGHRNRKDEFSALSELMNATGLHVPLNATVDTLTVGEQSRCEILKVLYRKSKILILDEPTAVLSPQEIASFLQTLKNLRNQGCTILLVTHKLKEVLAVADEITVMRSGRTVGTNIAPASTTVEALAEIMVGRKLNLPKNNTPIRFNSAHKSTPAFVFSKPNLQVRHGEILGIAGIEGNGQENLVAHVLKHPEQVRKTSTAIIPPDRHSQGLVLNMTLEENLSLGREQIAHHGLNPRIASNATHKVQTFLKTHDIRPPEPFVTSGSLSGGNQQKLIIARELDYQTPFPKALLVCHPTRGVDLGAIEQIHQKLLTARRDGAGILLISSELEELLSLSDRIVVLFKNSVAGEFFPPFNESHIGLAMLTGQIDGPDNEQPNE